MFILHSHEHVDTTQLMLTNRIIVLEQNPLEKQTTLIRLNEEKVLVYKRLHEWLDIPKQTNKELVI